MAEQITITSQFVDNVSGPVQTMAGNVSSSMKKIQTTTGTTANSLNVYSKTASANIGGMANNVSNSMNKVQKSTAGATSMLDKWTRRLLGFEMIRRVFNMMTNLLKDFDKQTGAVEFTNLVKNVNEFGLVFAQSLQPVLEQINLLFAEWGDKITGLVSFIGNLSQAFVVALNGIAIAANLVTLAFQAAGVAIAGWKEILTGEKDINAKQRMKGIAETILLIREHAIRGQEALKNFQQAFVDLYLGVAPIPRKIKDNFKENTDFIISQTASANNTLAQLWTERNHELARFLYEGGELTSKEILINLNMQVYAYKEAFEKIKLQYADEIVKAKGHYNVQEKLIASFKEAVKKHYAGLSLIYGTASIKLANNSADIVKNLTEIQEKLNENSKRIKEAEDTVAEANADLAKATNQAFHMQRSDWASLADSIVSMSQTITTATTYAMSKLDEQTEKEKEAARIRIMGREKMTSQEKKLQAEYDKIEEKAAKERKELRKKQLYAEWATAIANTATGATQALADMPYPANLVAMASVIAAGAVQTAIIIDQLANIDKYKAGGIVGGERVGDRNLVRANAGEVILNESQQRRLLALANGGGTGGGQGIIVNESIVVNGNLDMQAADRVRSDREKQLSKLRQDLIELNYRGQLAMA